MISAPFRFDAADHIYTRIDTGEIVPSITQMLMRTGHLDDRWWSEESSVRGIAVHALTADFDLGALDPARCVSKYRGWLLAHIKALEILQPEIHAVEEPLVHPVLNFGGRPDRTATLLGQKAVLEIKSGAPEKGHSLQTALQAILVSMEFDLPPQFVARFALYLKDNGKFSVVHHKDRRDLVEALRIVRVCT